jgi:FKBP-type peptidyl-prolyl cis-trans isomerase FkpA
MIIFKQIFAPLAYKFMFLLLLFGLFSASCRKLPDYADEDEAAIQAYLQAENIINYERDENTGIYWYFSTYPNSILPTTDSQIEVRYTGYFLDGTMFYTTDTNSIRIDLPQAMVGWRLGLIHFPVGSRGRLIVPSRFAYGADGFGDIVPANKILLFDIELLDIHPFF